MRDRFSGKTWIYWAQFGLLSGLGLFALVFGIQFWSGVLTDASGQARPQAGPPLVIVGCCLLVVAALAAFNIIAHMTPVIRCFREGIECNLVGATALDGVPLLPSLVRLAWTVVSLQGFRSQRLRMRWSDFAGAQVTGAPLASVLSLLGTLTHQPTGRVSREVTVQQAGLVDHPSEVAATLYQFVNDSALRDRLPSWDRTYL